MDLNMQPNPRRSFTRTAKHGLINTIILHDQSTLETQAILHGGKLLEHVDIIHSNIPDLSHPAITYYLKNGAVPVGSIDFVQAAMRIAGISEPNNISYPTRGHHHLHREIKKVRAGEVIGRLFVKPTKANLFSGFVYDSEADPANYSEHEKSQYNAFTLMDPNDTVWISEPVNWLSEWRYYVVCGEIIGSAKYDKIKSIVHIPNITIVKKFIHDIEIEHPYVVDFGVLSNGETALVEVNDACYIGLLEKALVARDYLDFLRKRWSYFKIPNFDGNYQYSV